MENNQNGLDENFIESEAESKHLLNLDPKEWKVGDFLIKTSSSEVDRFFICPQKQDHYEVLGLSSLRYKATPGQINFAHRRKVLKHHPDKKAKLGGDVNDDAFFKCIQKAYEQLIHPEKRRSFDSVDAGIPDHFAPKTAVPPEEFLEYWNPIFDSESRFSKKVNVPSLGTMEDEKIQVETFYEFWYSFDSWRSYEYNDKEVNEGADRYETD